MIILWSHSLGKGWEMLAYLWKFTFWGKSEYFDRNFLFIPLHAHQVSYFFPKQIKWQVYNGPGA